MPETFISLAIHEPMLFWSELDASDYTLSVPVGGTGSFEQNGARRFCALITIMADDRVEGTESFNVSLTGSNEVEVSSTADMATVAIIDDDGE